MKDEIYVYRRHTHAHEKIDVIPLYTCFLIRLSYFLLRRPPLLGLFVFFAGALLRAFFAGVVAAAVFVDVFAAAVGAAAAAATPVDDFVAFFGELFLAFDAPAAFFLGDAAFFFGLLALALSAAFALGATFDFGLAVRAKN
jgi:hypothetical protein